MLRSLLPCVLLTLSCAEVGTATPSPTTPASQAPDTAADTGRIEATAPAKPERPAKVAAQAHAVDSGGHAINVWSKSADSPRDVIVLVHGRTWSARPDFDLQVEGESRSSMDAFVAEGFAVYAVDLRGYGDTPRDDTGWLTPDQAAADLAAVLSWVATQHADLPTPSVLGWSMGSMVAHLTAQKHPELQSSVILYGYPRGPSRKKTRDPDEPSKPPRKPTTVKAAIEDFIVKGAISQAASDAFGRAAVEADPVRADWRNGEQWNAMKAAALHVPTLLIHGERDPYAPLRVQGAVFMSLGHADRQWVVLAGCDHAAHLERCGPRFVQAVVGFVRRPSVE